MAPLLQRPNSNFADRPVVIPSEGEGSKTDFSLRWKQGFLAQPILSMSKDSK
jgi:hypothetical protein